MRGGGGATVPVANQSKRKRDACATLARAVTALLALVGTACRNDMYNQPKLKPLAESQFFRDGAAARSLPANVIPREADLSNTAWTTGLMNGVYITHLPMPLTREVLQRGRERYDIYCAVCHGANGEGNGMIPQRGFPAPPTFHSDRLRNAPIGHFFDVIRNGYGVMYPYGARVSIDDRWAIAAYIRALQLSRSTPARELSSEEQKKLKEQP